MAQAKSLRARLKFQRRTTTDDGYGNLEGAWADLAPSVERYGEQPLPPDGAGVYFRGHDPIEGLLTKYAIVDERIDA